MLLLKALIAELAIPAVLSLCNLPAIYVFSLLTKYQCQEEALSGAVDRHLPEGVAKEALPGAEDHLLPGEAATPALALLSVRLQSPGAGRRYG